MRYWTGLVMLGAMFATVLATPGAAALATAAPPAASKSDLAAAIGDAERAVKIAPTDAAYRAQLGRLYLAAGRFASADTAFGDALALDPSLGRIAVSRALAQMVLGHGDAARESLARARGKAPDADVGLALALAGRRDDALTLLEGAVRAGTADARTRQNLALVYALAGRWADTATLAARDVPSDRMADRLQRWALIAQKSSRGGDQVLAILGVTIAQDPGQPTDLALVVPTRQPEQAVAVATIMVEQPVASINAPIETVVAPVAAKPVLRMKVAMARMPSAGRFVVQLGAYVSARRVETAWRQLAGADGYLSPYMPVQSQASGRAKRAGLYRLALSGFGTRVSAARVCRRIKAHGGNCFVRAAAGDRPMTWAKAGRDQDRA